MEIRGSAVGAHFYADLCWVGLAPKRDAVADLLQGSRRGHCVSVDHPGRSELREALGSLTAASPRLTAIPKSRWPRFRCRRVSRLQVEAPDSSYATVRFGDFDGVNVRADGNHLIDGGYRPHR